MFVCTYCTYSREFYNAFYCNNSPISFDKGKTDIIYEEIVCSQWHNKEHLIVLITCFDKCYKFQKYCEIIRYFLKSVNEM